jgi:hypothetical protein
VEDGSASDSAIHRIGNRYARRGNYLVLDSMTTSADDDSDPTLQFSVLAEEGPAVLSALRTEPDVVAAWLGEEFPD